MLCVLQYLDKKHLTVAKSNEKLRYSVKYIYTSLNFSKPRVKVIIINALLA